MEVERMKELESRRRIYQYIFENPGVHYREIARNLNIPFGSLDYHLSYLSRHGMVTILKDGGYTRYYARKDVDARKKNILSVLRHELPRAIVLFLMKNGGARHKEITEAFNVSGATISYHLKRMLEKGILLVEGSGREHFYTVRDPDMVADVLITYRRSFGDRLVDAFVRSWILEKKEERG